MSYGSISTDASKVQLDGKTYAVGDIVPFVANDPYFEITENSAGELVAFESALTKQEGSCRGISKAYLEMWEWKLLITRGRLIRRPCWIKTDLLIILGLPTSVSMRTQVVIQGGLYRCDLLLRYVPV